MVVVPTTRDDAVHRGHTSRPHSPHAGKDENSSER